MAMLLLPATAETLGSPIHSPLAQKTSDGRVRGEAEIPTVFGLSYHEARELLIEAGWIPLLQSPSYRQQEPSLRSGHGQTFWEQGYREVTSCSGTGEGFCRFEFTDPSGRKLIVITAGLESPEMQAQAMVRNVSLEP
ncbi:MAG: hypothetical protein EA367_02530 [Leptolyngbya sp. DLM2.Bin15]|nr:MAG: hypothetical protein EA367_02530 [Leptolyngbya sp. DLM2.Bin15]